MPPRREATARIVKAIHGYRKVDRDPDFELGLSGFLSHEFRREELLDLYQRFSGGEDKLSFLMRRAIFRALVR